MSNAQVKNTGSAFNVFCFFFVLNFFLFTWVTAIGSATFSSSWSEVKIRSASS